MEINVANNTTLLESAQAEQRTAEATLDRIKAQMNLAHEEKHDLEAKVAASNKARSTRKAGHEIYTAKFGQLPVWARVQGEKLSAIEEEEIESVASLKSVLKDAETEYKVAEKHADELKRRVDGLVTQQTSLKQSSDACYSVVMVAKTRQANYKPIFDAAMLFEEQENATLLETDYRP